MYFILRLVCGVRERANQKGVENKMKKLLKIGITTSITYLLIKQQQTIKQYKKVIKKYKRLSESKDKSITLLQEMIRVYKTQIKK